MQTCQIEVSRLHIFAVSVEGDIDGIEPFLVPELRLEGTLSTYNSASEYLNALIENPPEECDYKILIVTDNDGEVAVFYIYRKPNHNLPIAQLFKIRNNKIYEVLLIFDGRSFD